MSHRLHAYLALERAMAELDAVSDPLADEIRDRMDGIWYGLSNEDRELLDRRSGAAESFAGTVPVEFDASPRTATVVTLLPAVLEVIDAPA